MDNKWIDMYLYFLSPQSVLDSTDAGNTSTYNQAQYLDRPASLWAPSHQSNMVQGPSYGSYLTNNYGSDYFMDAWGYDVGYAPSVAPSEPPTYGAGQWVGSPPQYVAQVLPSTSWSTRHQV